LLKGRSSTKLNRKSQSVRHYLAKLQKLAETCEFDAYCEEAIRDQLLCGLCSQAIQRKLLAEAASKLMEKEASGFHGDSHDVQKVEKNLSECFRCGKTNHYVEKCFHHNA